MADIVYKVIPNDQRPIRSRAGAVAYDKIADLLRAGGTVELQVANSSGVTTAMKSRGIRIHAVKRGESYVVWQAEEK